MSIRKLLVPSVVAAVWAFPVHAQNARITVQTGDGESAVVVVDEGRITINGETIVEFGSGSDLSAMISSMLSGGTGQIGIEGLDLSELLSGTLQDVTLESAERHELMDRVRARLGDEFEAVNFNGIQLERALIHQGDLNVRAGDRIEGDVVVLDGDANVSGIVTGSVVAVDGNVRVFESGRIDGDALNVQRATAVGSGTGRAVVVAPVSNVDPVSAASVSFGGPSLFGVIGGLIALIGIGFGMSHFFPQPMEILSSTVYEAGGKSFLAGAFSLPLIPVLFGLGVIGLALTVVGILVIPIAAVGAGGVLALIALAGYIATAQSIGRWHAKRQFNRGNYVASGPFRNMVYGLVALTAVWMPSALLGWVPVVGDLATFLALMVTGVAVTTGLGAAVLSRRELKAVFIKSQRRSLTDEFPIVTSG